MLNQSRIRRETMSYPCNHCKDTETLLQLYHDRNKKIGQIYRAAKLRISISLTLSITDNMASRFIVSERTPRARHIMVDVVTVAPSIEFQFCNSLAKSETTTLWFSNHDFKRLGSGWIHSRYIFESIDLCIWSF